MSSMSDRSPASAPRSLAPPPRRRPRRRNRGRGERATLEGRVRRSAATRQHSPTVKGRRESHPCRAATRPRRTPSGLRGRSASAPTMSGHIREDGGIETRVERCGPLPLEPPGIALQVEAFLAPTAQVAAARSLRLGVGILLQRRQADGEQAGPAAREKGPGSARGARWGSAMHGRGDRAGGAPVPAAPGQQPRPRGGTPHPVGRGAPPEADGRLEPLTRPPVPRTRGAMIPSLGAGL